ncbi:MAG: beta-N-acetylhexosaminidase [Chitinivibrionia bacterium]|nr:beta-N-acetylhexosaminidase [Chitinivibrionia bacterium]
MKKLCFATLATFLSMAIISCSEDKFIEIVKNNCDEYNLTDDPNLTATSIIPKPSSYIEKEGQFLLTKNSKIVIKANKNYDEIKQNIAEYLSAIIRKSTGFTTRIALSGENSWCGDIILALDYSEESTEAYTLKVERNLVTITANSPQGLFYGVQTLRQMFGADIESQSPLQNKEFRIKCAQISDSPAYQYRGLMIDVARHFFSKEIIMRQIDLAAQYKINKLHLHLTDDQGWRIEIKSRPTLTEIGSRSAVNNNSSGYGYYTQKDFKDIVEYAAARYIEVIPEIDMPGHVQAALASVPELNSDGRSPPPYYGIAVGFSSLQCREETTYEFVEDVIREISAISPSKYFHIGGDEAAATSNEDYDYFIGRVSNIVQKYGKTTIGWSPYDRADGTLQDAVLQSWIGNTVFADQKNLPVFLSPAMAYLDQKYNSSTALGLSWRGYVNLEMAYSWYPVLMAPNSNLIGIESTLWAETLISENDIDYMLYPRLLANAEVGWTTEKDRWQNFSEFRKRLERQLERLDAQGVNYSKDYD